MGIPYKLESKIVDFILETRKTNPNLGCRKFSDLIWEKFQIKVSKSSVNAMLKNSGLSKPVGRRKKKLSGPAVETNNQIITSDQPQKPLEGPVDKQIEKYIEKPLQIIPLKQPILVPVKEEQPVSLSVDKPVEKPQEIAPIEPEKEKPLEPTAEKPAELIQEDKIPEPVEEKLPDIPSEKPPEPIEEKPPEPTAEKPAELIQEGTAEKPEALEISSVQEITPPEPVAEKPPEPITEKPAEPIEKAEPAEKPQPLEIESVIEEQAELFVDSDCCGALLLKAADCLLGGTYYITETIKNKLQSQSADLSSKTEYLLFSQLKPDINISFPPDKHLSAEDISLYSAKLESIKELHSDIFEVISSTHQEVHYLTVAFSDNTVFCYLDAQLYTIWSTPSIPDDFSSTTYKVKNYIKNCFQENMPLVLFTAPGYDTPPQEFFNYIITQTESRAKISRLTTFNNRTEQLEGIGIDSNKSQLFVFGLWPWQFTDYRKVKKMGKFSPLFFEALKKNLYVAEIVLELSQPYSADVTAILRGCVLKTGPEEKARIIILSNLAVEPQELANIYLNRWPNLEETFKDYSHKIELFTYTANLQRNFSSESQNLSEKQEFVADINILFGYYLKALDLYVRWRFLPLGFEDMDFSQMKQTFYNLKVEVKKDKDSVIATFQIPPAYPHLKALEYACQRINEREVILKNGKRLWMQI